MERLALWMHFFISDPIDPANETLQLYLHNTSTVGLFLCARHKQHHRALPLVGDCRRIGEQPSKGCEGLLERITVLVSYVFSRSFHDSSVDDDNVTGSEVLSGSRVQTNDISKEASPLQGQVGLKITF